MSHKYSVRRNKGREVGRKEEKKEGKKKEKKEGRGKLHLIPPSYHLLKYAVCLSWFFCYIYVFNQYVSISVFKLSECKDDDFSIVYSWNLA